MADIICPEKLKPTFLVYMMRCLSKEHQHPWLFVIEISEWLSNLSYIANYSENRAKYTHAYIIRIYPETFLDISD